MSAAQQTKVRPKPSGYKDGGGVWLNDKSVYGMRYACKSCGRKGSGYGGEERSHYDDCPVTQHYRDERAKRDAKRVEEAAESRKLLAAQSWDDVSDERVIRLAGILKEVTP